MKLSTALRNYVLATGGWKAALAGGELRLFGGTPPATADAAITGTLLCVVKNGGSGINLDAAAVNGIIPKAPAETWSGVNVATGVVTHFRWVQAADDNSSSTSAVRLQGTVDVAGADVNLSSTSLTSGATQDVDTFFVVQPAG